MTPEEAYEALAAALRRANDARDKTERELASLRAEFDYLVDLLAAKALLTDGHKRLITEIAGRQVRAARPKVRLRLLVDKYEIPDAGIDCEARLPLCHGRCCAFSFELTTQDLDEGKVRWEVEEPYVIRHERDGFCSHRDRETLGCTIYEHRPAACRGFDCRGDKRVWIDFDQRIPAPMPDGLLPIRR